MVLAVELISKNMRRLRALKGLSQMEVSLDSGISQWQCHRIENGKVEPYISTLEKLATGFEVSIAAFFKLYDLKEELNLPIMKKIKND